MCLTDRTKCLDFLIIYICWCMFLYNDLRCSFHSPPYAVYKGENDVGELRGKLIF